MPVWHFELLAEHAHECEIEQAKYIAIAVNDPKKLWEMGGSRDVSPEQDKKNMERLKMIAKGGMVK